MQENIRLLLKNLTDSAENYLKKPRIEPNPLIFPAFQAACGRLTINQKHPFVQSQYQHSIKCCIPGINHQ